MRQARAAKMSLEYIGQDSSCWPFCWQACLCIWTRCSPAGPTTTHPSFLTPPAPCLLATSGSFGAAQILRAAAKGLHGGLIISRCREPEFGVLSRPAGIASPTCVCVLRQSVAAQQTVTDSAEAEKLPGISSKAIVVSDIRLNLML